jgi:hypothetical protein
MNKIEKLLIATLLTTTLSTSFLSLADEIQPGTNQPAITGEKSFDPNDISLEHDFANKYTNSYFATEAYMITQKEPALKATAEKIEDAVWKESYKRNAGLSSMQVSDIVDRILVQDYRYNEALKIASETAIPSDAAIQKIVNQTADASHEIAVDPVITTDQTIEAVVNQTADASHEIAVDPVITTDKKIEAVVNNSAESSGFDSASQETTPDFVLPATLNSNEVVNVLVDENNDALISALAEIAQKNESETSNSFETDVNSILKPIREKISEIYKAENNKITQKLDYLQNKSYTTEVSKRARLARNALQSESDKAYNTVKELLITRAQNKNIILEARTKGNEAIRIINDRVNLLVEQGRTREANLLKDQERKLKEANFISKFRVKDKKDSSEGTKNRYSDDQDNTKRSFDPTPGTSAAILENYREVLKSIRKLAANANLFAQDHEQNELTIQINKIESVLSGLKPEQQITRNTFDSIFKAVNTAANE